MGAGELGHDEPATALGADQPAENRIGHPGHGCKHGGGRNADRSYGELQGKHLIYFIAAQGLVRHSTLRFRKQYYRLISIPGAPCENRYMKAILICPAEKLRKQFEAAIGALKGVALCKVLTEFPPEDVLRRIVRARAPQVIFIGVEQSEGCETTNNQLETESPWIQRIGLHDSKDPATFRLALRLRMHEALW